jgi:hypothetical protein
MPGPVAASLCRGILLLRRSMTAESNVAMPCVKLRSVAAAASAANPCLVTAVAATKSTSKSSPHDISPISPFH